MRAFSIALASLLACTALNASADRLFGIYAGLGSWNQEVTGEFSSVGQAIDLQDDLGLQDNRGNVMYFALEHFVPFVPNFRVQKIDIAINGDGILSREIEFNGTTFAINEPLVTDIRVDQIDGLLYWQLLDNVVSLDLGVAARYMDGSIDVVSTLQSESVEFKGALPMLYGRARIDLPLTGAWVAAELQGLGYGGNKILDMTAQIGWESKWGLGVEAGWRSLDIDLDAYDDIDSASLEISGPYAAINYHF
ncbi:MAG: TIGR04219 family outer membrane beta-barrel protein [Gammaproteobacteria bacterium]|nr:TIGR04219 family outer membrane beta-barrel protein [Gammaproteobacteria bacterium]